MTASGGGQITLGVSNCLKDSLKDFSVCEDVVMSFKLRSALLVCGALLLAGGCGDDFDSPALPGPVAVSDDFIAATQYNYTPGSVLETTSLRVDCVNPVIDLGVAVRDTPEQGSGEARQANIEAVLEPLDASLDSNALAIKIAQTIPPLEIIAFAPNDARLRGFADLGGLVLRGANLNDQRIRVGSTFRTQTTVGVLPTEPPSIPTIPTPTPTGDTEDPGEPQQPDPTSQTFSAAADPALTFTIGNIFVDPTGTNIVLEGPASLITQTTRYINEASGLTIPEDDEVLPTAVMTECSFSAQFVVRERGQAGPGNDEDPLTLLAELHFEPNQAEVLFRPFQSGTSSALFAPSPERVNILTNQLVRIRRLLDGRIEAEFDPANLSTVLNFTRVSPVPDPFPTPVPQSGVPADPEPPFTFDYFFSLRTERDDFNSGVRLESIVPVTGNFIFRNLAGSRLAGPFNRADIGGATTRGNLNLVFDDTTNPNALTGTWTIEQEFPADNEEQTSADPPDVADTGDLNGTIVIIRGTFNGEQISL